mgnify:CR=1 FL=1
MAEIPQRTLFGDGKNPTREFVRRYAFFGAIVVMAAVKLDDVDSLWQLWTDPDVRRFLWDDRTVTREEAAVMVADWLSVRRQGLGLWTLHAGAPVASGAAPDRTLQGCAGLMPVTTAAAFDGRIGGLVEPLVALAPRAWRRGYAQAARAALQRHAMDALGLITLAGVTDVPNDASHRMLARAGLVPLGEVPGPRYRLRTYLWHAFDAAVM